MEIEATLSNIRSVASVNILLKYPSGSIKLFRTHSVNFSLLRHLTYRLKPTIIQFNIAKGEFLFFYFLKNNDVSDVNFVEISVVRVFTPELSNPPAIQPPHSTQQMGYVHLCTPCKFYLLPKEGAK